MDVVFIENQPFFGHNYLQGEKKEIEDEFWQTSKPKPHPNVFLDIDIHSLKGQKDRKSVV